MNTKRVFYKRKAVYADEEIIVKENHGLLILSDFYLYNMGKNNIYIRINGAEEEILLEPECGIEISQTNVESCIIVNDGEVEYGGLY